MVYVSPDAHRKLKLIAAQRALPIGAVVADLVDREIADLAAPWTGPNGLLLQQRVLAQVWDDPELDVYDAD